MPFREAVRAVPLRLICLLVIGHVAFAGNRFALTLQAVALHASPLAIGLVVSLLTVAPISCRSTWDGGPIVSASGGRRLGLIALALGSVLAGVLSQSMLALCASSVLVGSGYNLAHVAINNAVGQRAPAQRLTQSFSILALGFSLSGVAGPLLGGVIIDHLGHATAFLAMLVFACVSLGLLWPLLRGAVRVTAPASAPRRAACSACCSTRRCARC